jgi:serine/threonine protein kinase
MHRDIKLENVLIGNDAQGNRTAILADYGLARKMTTDTVDDQCGSVGFVAPEVFQKPYGLAADIYSIGCVAFTILTARMPFGNDPEHIGKRNATGDVRFLSEIWGNIS